MPTVYREVEVDFDASDLDDDEMIEVLEHRGYKVLFGNQEDEDETLQEMIWRYKNGYIEDAMIMLERRFPEMNGISKRIQK